MMSESKKPEEMTKEVEIAHVTKVSWFDVRQLMATAAQALAAGIIGPMSGRREIMAALTPASDKDENPEDKTPDYTGEDTLWLDYMADCGDGWNASHSVAWLMGRNALHLDEDRLQPVAQAIPADGSEESNGAIAGTTRLEHGKVMILGGDQVYPTASKELYQKRFTNVFRSARFWQKPPRDVYALPGNHDWYDGLTSFVRLFCQGGKGRRWIGAWKTQQHRSYFAIQLPHGWWLWGLDMSLGDDLDPPQQQYFRDQAELLKENDRVIVCLPDPIWLKAKDSPAELAKLDLIIKMAEGGGEDDFAMKQKKNITVPLVLTGDHHYYARHRADLSENEKTLTDSRDYIICGGGGAFGLGTLQTPDRLKIEKARESAGTANLESVFPTREESVKARRGVFKFPFVNKAFSAMLVALNLLTLWALSATWLSSGDANCQHGKSWIAANMCSEFSFTGLGGILESAVGLIGPSAALILWLLLLVGGFGMFGRASSPDKKSAGQSFVVGAGHAVLQSLAGLVSIWLAAKLVDHWLKEPILQDNVDSALNQWMVIPIASLFAFLICGFIFGAYLFFSHKFFRMHDQEVFSAQGIEEFKCFLRMRVNKEGLTVYPIGLKHSSRKWVTAPGVQEIGLPKKSIFESVWTLKAPLEQSRLFDPVEPLKPHLIEKPFLIPSNQAKGDGS